MHAPVDTGRMGTRDQGRLRSHGFAQVEDLIQHNISARVVHGSTENSRVGSDGVTLPDPTRLDPTRAISNTDQTRPVRFLRPPDPTASPDPTRLDPIRANSNTT